MALLGMGVPQSAMRSARPTGRNDATVSAATPRMYPQLKSIPVVAVTAFAMKGDEERIREGGCEAYLSKPISVGKFIETIKSFLGNA